MIIAILGKSCVGKDTVVKKLAKFYARDSRVSVVKSFTTRPKRIDEENGREYNFITDEEYVNLYREKQLVVNTIYFVGKETYKYGITKEELEKSDINLVVLNPYSLEQIKKIYPNSQIFTILLETNNIKRIFRYLKRDKITIQNILNCFRRLRADKKDFDKFAADYTIKNEEVDTTTNFIKNILDVELSLLEKNWK